MSERWSHWWKRWKFNRLFPFDKSKINKFISSCRILVYEILVMYHIFIHGALLIGTLQILQTWDFNKRCGLLKWWNLQYFIMVCQIFHPPKLLPARLIFILLHIHVSYCVPLSPADFFSPPLRNTTLCLIASLFIVPRRRIFFITLLLMLELKCFGHQRHLRKWKYISMLLQCPVIGGWNSEAQNSHLKTTIWKS